MLLLCLGVVVGVGVGVGVVVDNVVDVATVVLMMVMLQLWVLMVTVVLVWRGRQQCDWDVCVFFLFEINCVVDIEFVVCVVVAVVMD